MVLRAFKLERTNGEVDPKGLVLQVFRDEVERTLVGVRGTAITTNDPLLGPFSRLRIDDNGSLCLLYGQDGQSVSDRITAPVFDALLERHQLRVVLIGVEEERRPAAAIA